MNSRYNKIIREEINRLIFEAVDVSPLSKYMQPIKGYIQQLRNIPNTNNREIDKFFDDLNTYLIQILFGIDRCIKANSLNEAFNLSDYGINLPPELGGGLWGNMANSFYQTKNFMNRNFGGNGNGQTSGGATSRANANPNNVQSVKLAVSLRNLQKYQTTYTTLCSKYPNIMNKYNQFFTDVFNQLTALQREYTTLTTNAQGTNP